MNYYLKHMPNGRVYLCPELPTKKEKLLKTIEAPTWLLAIAKVETMFYEHRPADGYFMEHENVD